MNDTAQPVPAAETDASLDDVALAFKVSLGQAEPTERLRDDQGRFASAQAEEAEEEIEAEAEAGAESHDEEDEDEGAADEAQQPVDLPNSWPAEKAEEWQSLPPATQAFIREREGQRDAAVNAKFQEAANVLRTNESVVTEANTNRQRYAEAVDHVLALIQPQWPSATMLDANSGDYDPDTYHLQRAQAERQLGIIQSLSAQRENITAQEQQEAERAQQQQVEELNRNTAPAFLKDYPEAGDGEKAGAFFQGLVKFALDSGAPATFFQNGPVSAVEWHMIADAQKWRQLQAAKAKVKTEPKPEQKTAPAVRPGVTTPRSARIAASQQKDRDRLARSGSIEDAAAVFKHIL